MKVLIAEDDPVSRQLLSGMLSRWGYEVEATSNGAEAWEVLRKEGRPMLAVLDWMMPELDGIAVCRMVRETPATQLNYLILVSARAEREDILNALHAGANDYITKPYNRIELQVRVQVGAKFVELQRRLLEGSEALEAANIRIAELEAQLGPR